MALEIGGLNFSEFQLARYFLRSFLSARVHLWIRETKAMSGVHTKAKSGVRSLRTHLRDFLANGVRLKWERAETPLPYMVPLEVGPKYGIIRSDDFRIILSYAFFEGC